MSLIRQVGRVAFTIARTPVGGRLVAIATRFVPQLLPGVGEVRDRSVFLRHPAPIQQGHDLLLPRRRVPDYSFESPAMTAFLDELDTRSYPTTEFHLVTNLGVRQDVRLLHIHLFAGAAPELDWQDAPNLRDVHAQSRHWAAASLPQGGSVFMKPTSTGWHWATQPAP